MGFSAFDEASGFACAAEGLDWVPLFEVRGTFHDVGFASLGRELKTKHIPFDWVDPQPNRLAILRGPCGLLSDSGSIVITAFISPYKVDRERARDTVPGAFHEIYIKADLEVCEGRDPKGLYARARRGEINDFTGIDSPYEPPEQADLVVDTAKNSVEQCVELLTSYIDDTFGHRLGDGNSGMG